MQHLTSLTRLVLLDPDVLRQQLDGEAFVHTPARPAVPVGLSQLSKLQVLSFAMCRPQLHVQDLPASLSALHLDLASGAGDTQSAATNEGCQHCSACAAHGVHCYAQMRLQLSQGSRSMHLHAWCHVKPHDSFMTVIMYKLTEGCYVPCWSEKACHTSCCTP
jgi:hypothetical protein